MAKAYPLPEGGYTIGTSIVTLPGNPKLAHIHEKSVPLMIEDHQMDIWLDRSIPHQDLQAFKDSRLAHSMIVQAWHSTKTTEPAAASEPFQAD